MDKRLLTILCCPLTHKGLLLAKSDLLKKINAAIAEQKLVNREGVALSEPLKEALVTDDAKLLYPVKEGIPVLLEGESVGLDQLDAH